MKKRLRVVPLILFLFPMVNGQVSWIPDQELSEVFEMAKADDKLVFIYVYDEWSENTENIFQNQKVSSYINTNFYAMKFYRGDAKSLCQEYNIDKTPTVLFLDTYGEEIGGIEKFRTSNEFYDEMKHIVEASTLRAKLKDEAYQALTTADSLYAQGEYGDAKEHYTKALNKFQELGDEENVEYCKSRISDADLKMQFVLLQYGFFLFVVIVVFFSLIYYISKKEQ